MKVAIHFNADEPSLGGLYGPLLVSHTFRALLARPAGDLSSRVFVGDLMLHHRIADLKQKSRDQRVVDIRSTPERLIEDWKSPPSAIWRRYSAAKLDATLRHNVFVICFESIDLATAEWLHQKLTDLPAFLGALEIDDTSELHWQLYSNSLLPRYRLSGSSLYVFWDGPVLDPESVSKDVGAFEDLRKLPFESVQWLAQNGRFTIFDRYHDFPHASRVGEWRRRFGGLLAFVADNVVCGLSDVAPDLGDKLYAALNSFEGAETQEQLAQATASCRRVVEYVADRLFPPSTETPEEKVGPKHFRNRLRRFANETRRSNTNIDLVATSNALLSEQLEKLGDLANKGIHDEVYRAEVRRCLLRTVLLLDDILSFRTEPFEGRLS
jgi:hypothetical protein